MCWWQVYDNLWLSHTCSCLQPPSSSLRQFIGRCHLSFGRRLLPVVALRDILPSVMSRDSDSFQSRRHQSIYACLVGHCVPAAPWVKIPIHVHIFATVFRHCFHVSKFTEASRGLRCYCTPLVLNPIQPNPPAYWTDPIQFSVHSISKTSSDNVSEFDFICAVNAACG